MLSRSDIEIIKTIFREIVAEYQSAPVPALSDGSFENNRIYKLTDPEVHHRLGVATIKNPVPVLLNKLRSEGIHIDVRKRAGSTVLGSELNKYVSQIRKTQQSYLTKN